MVSGAGTGGKKKPSASSSQKPTKQPPRRLGAPAGGFGGVGKSVLRKRAPAPKAPPRAPPKVTRVPNPKGRPKIGDGYKARRYILRDLLSTAVYHACSNRLHILAHILASSSRGCMDGGRSISRFSKF